MAQKHILITGAGTGFGREVALRLAERGHDVTAGVRATAEIDDVAAAAAQRGTTLRAIRLDVTSAHDRALFDVNVFGPLELTQQIARGMLARRHGKIVFVSSIAGLITGPFTGAYCASKHAIESVAEAMHAELAPHGIRVAIVNPGPYRTGFNDRMMETTRRWHDPAVHTVTPERLTFPLEQHDPEEMVAKMVDVIDGDGGAFRNLLPAASEAFVRAEQARAWERQQ
ncbi:SDR family NAD(P)-dependent oxidoreductase [Burkholderia cenocepacia]|nr:SDR family NAD(P)-dependent oxidoreductase [Burkholderia cenocepacia]